MSSTPQARRPLVVDALLLAAILLAAGIAASAAESWMMLSDLDTTGRLWIPDGGPNSGVRVTADAAHSGQRGLSVELLPQGDRPMVRQTWGTDVSDLRWSHDSRLRFWLRGNALAGRPHGGVILEESNGRQGGGNSHWILSIPGETYSNTQWHQVTLGPLSTAENAEWAPDVNGRLDTERIVRVLFVAQQDGAGEEHVPYTVAVDDVEVSNVQPLPVRYADATVEPAPAHVTPIWRGFVGRHRAHPALVQFSDVTGWRVGMYGGAEAVVVRSEEEPCHEDLIYQAKISYRSSDGSGHVELVPPRPIPAPPSFNAARAWVYGNNWSWVPDPGTPPVNVWLRLRDAAGQTHRLDLGVVNFKFYGLLTKRLWDTPGGDPRHLCYGGPVDGQIHPPAMLEAIEIRGGTQPDWRTIYLESVALHQDDMPLPQFHPERLANLPFPTTPDTILPTLVQPAAVRLAALGKSFVFTASGDEQVRWRYRPQTGTLSDLTVAVAGRRAFRPCAEAGVVVVLAGRERGPQDPAVTRTLLSQEMDGDEVTTCWRASAEGDSVQYTITLRARGKSLVVDWRSEVGKVAALALGKADRLLQPRVVRVPYLNIYNSGPGILLDQGTFCSVLLDWYNTESSSFYCHRAAVENGKAFLNGGSLYTPLTDGSRNPMGERLFINVSSRFDEVLPNIPNPPSSQKAVSRSRLYCHIGGTAPNRFDGYLTTWREFHRKGIRQVRVSHHEDAWTDGADVGQGGQEYTMCTEAAPEVGDDRLIAYCGAMRAMGYYIGLYENFTDYNPLGKSWDERNCGRDSHGEMVRVWPPTYALRPPKALDMALDYPRRVAAKFGTSTAYRDCATAYPPWGQVDFQAGTPGAGKFSTNFRAWGALLMDGHKAYGGPIYSEGGHHWFSAGLVDGNYAQTGIYSGETRLLLDFDLRKIHPLEADISMTPGCGWGPDGIWSGLTATIAYGHIGFLPFGDATEAARYYYLIQQLQSRYTMEPVAEVLYHQSGRLRDASRAIEDDALGSNQVLVRYQNGLQVAANYNADRPWVVRLGAGETTLNGFSWAASGLGLEEFCTVSEGRRLGYVDCPAYLFADAGGKWHDFGPIATDGTVVLHRQGDLAGRLLVLGPTTELALQLAPGTKLRAFDREDKLLSQAALAAPDKARVKLPAATDYLILTR